jgi:pyridoxine/pyridoxamine 5'-phosphate oxidase
MPETVKPEIGAPFIWYGKKYEVVGFVQSDAGGEPVELIEIAEKGLYERRDAALAQIRTLRAEQAAMVHAENETEREAQVARHRELDQQIKALAADVGLVSRFRIRPDLVAFWSERKVWVSDGRILSDDEMREATKRMNGRPSPEMQRYAAELLGIPALAEG